jgi:hypothetical protein
MNANNPNKRKYLDYSWDDINKMKGLIQVLFRVWFIR